MSAVDAIPIIFVSVVFLFIGVKLMTGARRVRNTRAGGGVFTPPTAQRRLLDQSDSESKDNLDER